MNRREFLKFLGVAAAGAAVAPKVLADAIPPGSHGWCGATGVQGPVGPPGPIGPTGPAYVVLDPSMSIQEAIYSLPKEGGTIFIPRGIDIINQSIEIPANVRLIAEGDIQFIGCRFSGAARRPADAPITLLMDEEDQVLIMNNVFECDHVRSISDWFYVPIGETLAEFRRTFGGWLNALRSG